MTKLLFLIISALIFLFGPANLPEEKVTITQDYPAVSNAGGEFTVHVHLNTGTLKGNAILQLDLPTGFTAENIDSRNGDFTFENNTIKYIWVELPPINEFTVSYKVKVSPGVKGPQVIKGTFYYPFEGITEKYELPEEAVAISEQNTSENPPPKIERKLICTNKDLGEYTVELSIFPNNNSDHAQFTDEIPENFTALVIESHQSDFSFVNNDVIFNWEKLPSEQSFKISYMVRSGKPGPSPVINGTMTYGNASLERKEIASQKPEDMPAEINSEINLPAAETNNISPVNQDAQENSNPTISADNKNNNQTQAAPSSANVIYYKIQISATQRSSIKDSHWFSVNYNVDSPVELTYHEGWKKYLVGSFLGYDEAAEYKKKTQEKIAGAFIVAYQNGNRIPVKESMKSTAMNQ